MLRLFNKGTAKGKARAGVSLDESRVGLARVQRLDDDSLSLAACAFRTDENYEEWAERAETRVSSMGIRDAMVATVLRPHAYQLQMVEIPNVPEEERQGAVRWRVKDLIDYPIDEAVIELFEMPTQSHAGTKPTGYAVVSHRSEILSQIDLAAKAGLDMDVIDIPEFCMRNIAALMPQDRDGVAFLHLSDNSGYLTITRQRVLHLMRRIESGRIAIAEAEHDEFVLQERAAGIALEVQRSLDYYESHYNCQPVRELVISPGAGLDLLPGALTQHLGLSVSQIELDSLFNMENEISSKEAGNCVLAAGAALRMDEATVAAAVS